MSRAILAGLLALLSSPAAAHDFWIQPASFRLEPGAATPLTLQVGHGDQRQRSPIRIGRVNRFTATGPDGDIDLLPSLHPGEAASDGDIALPRPGTYVLALQTDRRAESHLPADRYNDYLNAEGLTPALELREKTGRSGADGSESYGRVAKALVLVGADPGPQAQVARPLGLELEIVTEASPYARPRPSSLPVRVYYRGQALAGATVKLTDLDHDAAPRATRVTDSQGRASFAMPAVGSWQFNVVWTRPLPASSSTEFETVFSSLSFGLPADGPGTRPSFRAESFQRPARQGGDAQRGEAGGQPDHLARIGHVAEHLPLRQHGFDPLHGGGRGHRQGFQPLADLGGQHLAGDDQAADETGGSDQHPAHHPGALELGLDPLGEAVAVRQDRSLGEQAAEPHIEVQVSH